MRRLGLASTAVLVFVGQGLCAAEDMKNTITAYGTGKVEVKPDVAYLTFYVKSTGVLMTDAAQKAKQKMDEVVKAVSEKHKEIKNIAVADIEIGESRKEYWRSDQNNEIQLPEVIKRLRITIAPNSQLAYDIADTAIRAGASLQVPSSIQYSGDIKSILVYGLQNSDEAENQAKTKALDNAKQNAEKMAALVGKKVGDAVAVGCSGSSSWSPEIRYIMGREVDFPVKYIGLDSEKLEVSHSVNITYELLKK